MAATRMEIPSDPNIATCPTCGTLIDVSEEAPFSRIHCSACGSSMRVRQQFANYDIQGVLGEGGQGVVYRGVDRTLNRPVAIKLMKREYSADPLFAKRFESEARVTASLNHPNIVKVFSFGSDRGFLYLAMEMVDKGSLDSLMTARKIVPEDKVLEVGIQIARGLKAGLERGLIHRDIKPGNILFSDEQTAKIVDFGLAVLVEKQHEEEGDVWATPYYVSPEKLHNQPEDFHSDMYSLAASLFHAVAGRPPFIAETNSMSELRKIKSKPVHLQTFAPHVGRATALVLDKALNARPQDRFASYDDFIHHLEYARNELRQGPKKPVPVPKVVIRGTPAWMKWLPAAAAVVIVLILVIVFSGGGDKPVVPAPKGTTLAETDENPDARYERARQQLIQAQFAAAAEAFRALHGSGKLGEPRNSWAAVHLGLAEYFAGKPEAARQAFADLSAKMSPTALGLDPRSVDFFHALSALATSAELPSAEDLAEFDETTTESVAFLALGLKSWQADAHEPGIALLRKFANSKLEPAAAWVGEYRPLVLSYLEDHGLFARTYADLNGYETSLEKAQAALAGLPALRARIKTPALLAKLNEKEREVRPKIAAAEAAAKAESERKLAELTAAETAVLKEARLKARNLCEPYRFKEALALLQETRVTAPEVVQERDLVARRIEWLVQFKEQLIRDLNTSGYHAPLQRRNGQQLIGTVAQARETDLDVRLAFGNLPITWAELSPQCVAAMAKSFFKPTLSREALADRQWLAGVFCTFTQQTNDGQALMDDAGSAKEEYRLHKAVYFKQLNARPDAVPPGPATPISPGSPKPPSTPTPGTPSGPRMESPFGNPKPGGLQG